MDLAQILLTLALVLLTGWYAKLTRHIAQSSSESAKAAEHAAEQASRAATAGEHAVRIELMPLVVVRWQRDSVHEGRVAFRVQNDGRSVAVTVEVLPEDDYRDRISIEALAPGAQHPKEQARTVVTERQTSSFGPYRIPARVAIGKTVEIIYNDVFGNRYRTLNALDPTSRDTTLTIEEDGPDGWRPLRYELTDPTLVPLGPHGD